MPAAASPPTRQPPAQRRVCAAAAAVCLRRAVFRRFSRLPQKADAARVAEPSRNAAGSN